MFDWNWILASGTELLMLVLSCIGIYIVLIVLTRIAGLRSFSKMSSFDFAITVAYGSVVASTILAEDPSLLVGAAALVVLYVIQYVVSKSRRLTRAVEHVIDNEPLLIMDEDRILSDNLDHGRMTEEDLKCQLRLAGITHPSQVLAVVFESTGDVSVIRRQDDVSSWMFEGVRGAERLISATTR